MRTITAALMATTLFVSSAFAGPLPTGKPAGVKEAAIFGPSGFLIVLGAGILVGGIVLATTNNGNNGVTTTSTNSTSTTGLP